MSRLHKFPLKSADTPDDDRDDRRDDRQANAPTADEARAWAEAAMVRCAELERVLRQVVVWFDSPLDAGGAANDDPQRDEIINEAMTLNRVIDRAIALLEGQDEDAGDAAAASPLIAPSSNATLLN